MSFIYVDESGDLGTKPSSSRYFVIVAIKIDDSRKLERLVKKTRLRFKKELLNSNEIKGGYLPSKIKIHLLKRLNKIDCEILIIVFDKRNRYKACNYCDNNELYDVLASELSKLIKINKPTFMFIDKSKYKQKDIFELNERILKNVNNVKKHPIQIEHANSIHYKGLQVADLISWSVFQNFENKNDEFINIIKNKTIKTVFED